MFEASTAHERHVGRLLSMNEKWRERRSALQPVIGSALDASWAAICSLAVQADLSTTEIHRLMMWQTCRLYQINGLILLAGTQLDGGLALVRMATELARDISYIGEDSERLEVWLNRSEAEAKKKYRKTFRFDTNDPAGAYVKSAYDLCSEWGVHSHLSGASHLDVRGVYQDVAGLDVTEAGIDRAVGVWCCSFVPIVVLCARSFLPTRSTQLVASINDLLSVGDTLCTAGHVPWAG
jgi:hypothetical protein